MALCGVAGILLVILAGVLLEVSLQTSSSLKWVSHSAEVINSASRVQSLVKEAEAAERGWVLTRDKTFGTPVKPALDQATHHAGRMTSLTTDNPGQNNRATAVKALLAERRMVIEEISTLAAAGNFAAAQAITASGRGRELTRLIDARIGDMLIEERTLATSRVAEVERRLTVIRWLVIVGVPLTMLFIGVLALSLIRGIRRPVRSILKVMDDLGTGNRAARIVDRVRSSEFEQLAGGYNTMADRLEAAVSGQIESQQDLERANASLNSSATILRERGEVITLLGGMAHRMQAARTDEELAAIINIFVPRVLPDVPGVLYVHNNSRNLLVPTASWGGLDIDAEGFAPEQCWALRRGQSHFVREPGSDIVCAHVPANSHGYHCEPLLAGGEVIGVLYLKGTIGEENGFRLSVLTENIASALVNHKLQRGLREQTIRDPLTGLFNRRYMEETLALEVARAARSGSPLTLMMCDVDHFKRFNDEFGHDAGDLVLQTVASELRRVLRDGDVVCRFGGEEFIVIAPATTIEAMAERAELVRHAISLATVKQAGRTLGTVTMSFGVAQWDSRMDREGTDLIKTADARLYAAKRNGRNRVVIGGDATPA